MLKNVVDGMTRESMSLRLELEELKQALELARALPAQPSADDAAASAPTLGRHGAERGRGPQWENMVQQLMRMRFPRAAVLAALGACQDDPNAAAELLRRNARAARCFEGTAPAEPAEPADAATDATKSRARPRRSTHAARTDAFFTSLQAEGVGARDEAALIEEAAALATLHCHAGDVELGHARTLEDFERAADFFKNALRLEGLLVSAPPKARA